MTTETKSADITISDLVTPQSIIPDPKPAEPVDADKDKDKNKGDKPADPPAPVEDEDKGDKPDVTKTFNTEENKTKIKGFLSSLNAEQLSDENKAIREDLLAKHKGVSINENGDILNDKGEVVAKFEDVFKDLVDEPAITLDEEGNQIDDKGTIIKTKAQLAAETEGDLLNNAHTQLEYEFLDDKGKTKVYSNNVEGVKELVKDYGTEMGKEVLNKLYSTFPVLSEVVKHLQLGKDLKDFEQATDYSKVDKKTLSTEQKLETIRRSLLVKDLEKDRIESYLSFTKDSNSVDKEYDIAVNVLKDYDNTIKTNRQKELDAATAKEEKQIQDHWNNVNSHIKDNKVAFVTIPDNEKEAFFNYMSNAIDDKGNSQEILDMSKDSLENRLGLAYLRFKKFDFNSVIKQKMRETRVVGLRDKILQSAKAESQNMASVGDTASKQQPDITIERLLAPNAR